MSIAVGFLKCVLGFTMSLASVYVANMNFDCNSYCNFDCNFDRNFDRNFDPNFDHKFDRIFTVHLTVHMPFRLMPQSAKAYIQAKFIFATCWGHGAA